MNLSAWALLIAGFGLLGGTAAAQTAEEHFNKGAKLELAGDLDGALGEFGSAIELAPGVPSAYLHRAKIEMFRQDYEHAYSDANTAVQLNPNSPDFYDMRGEVRVGQKDLEGAVDDFDRAIRLNPAAVMALNDRGYIHFLQHDLKAALADYDRAIAAKGDSSPVFMNRYRARLAAGDVAGAKADLERYIELQPDSPYGYMSRSDDEWQEGHYDLSLTDIDRALKLKPDEIGWYFQRSSTQLGKRDFAKSLADLDHFLAAADPVDEFVPYARFFRHLDLLKLGRGNQDDLASRVSRMEDGWPKSVGLFLTGGLSRDEFKQRALVAPDKDQKRDQLCECSFYLGIVDRFAGRLGDAKREFNACIETGQDKFIEYMLAKGELA